MLGLSRVVCVVAIAGLAACGDDGPTNRPPEDDATSSATFPFTTSLSTSLSGTTEDSSGTDTDTDTGDESDTVASTTDVEFCPGTHRCIAEAPEGWEGPGPALTAAVDAALPMCGADYPDAGVMGFEGLAAPPATCGCECGEPSDVECEQGITLRYWGSAECEDASSTQVTVFAGICTNLPSAFPADSYWQIDVVEASGGSCSGVEEEVVEPASWEMQVATCGGGALLGGCAVGNVCAPRPEEDGAPLCVWRLGEHECPVGYDDTRMVYSDVDDTRACAPCTCSEPAGVCDEVRVTLTGNFNCNVPIANVFEADAECHFGSGIDVRAAAVSSGEPNAFCVPSEPMPVGEAIGAEPITLCCD